MQMKTPVEFCNCVTLGIIVYTFLSFEKCVQLNEACSFRIRDSVRYTLYCIEDWEMLVYLSITDAGPAVCYRIYS
jgi:hypothetical protein